MVVFCMENYKIYVHINKINGKIYIGQTGQENVKDRWDSGWGYKQCVAFNNAINKYGWNNFQHIVLIDRLTLEMANIIEEELIKKYELELLVLKSRVGALEGIIKLLGEVLNGEK